LRPVPSLCTIQSELCTSGVTCRANAISLPCGDQLNAQQLTCIVGGRIRLRPVPFALTTKTPSGSPFGSNRSKTICLPFGDQLPGASSPPGFDVIWVKPPPSDARIVWIPFWLPSLLNVSHMSSVPSGDGDPHPLNRFGSGTPTSRYVPSSGLMIRDSPMGEPQVAMWAPSGNQRGHSPASVGAWTSLAPPAPSGLTTYTCVSPSVGLNRAY